MITNYAINEERKSEYYQKGYWTEKTLLDYWDEQVNVQPDKNCVCDDLGVRLTYKQVDKQASCLASWLVSVGVGKGDVVSF